MNHAWSEQDCAALAEALGGRVEGGEFALLAPLAVDVSEEEHLAGGLVDGVVEAVDVGDQVEDEA